MWFTRLGMRSLDVQGRLPVLDQVVLVPDAATYLDEIARWTPTARWPVLFEDAAFAPRFVRAFKPAAVYRRASIGGAAPAGDALRAQVERAVVRAWGGPENTTVGAALRAIGLVPAGIVAASAADPAWTAAVALAAGRGQPVAWLDGDYGKLSTVLGKPAFDALSAAVDKAFQDSGNTWNALGDDLDTLTLCRNTAFRCTIPSPPGGWHPRLPPRDAAPLATTDALCRTASGKRYAFAAQIPGDEIRAASMAMCSLFLHRTTAFMFNGYAGRSEQMFAEFGFAQAATGLGAQGFACVVKEGGDASPTAWRTMVGAGLDADLILVNSAGNADFFQLSGETVMWATDIPVLDKPAALAMVHSFSLQVPDAGWSIGGRWLDHGVYAYAGSVQEPFLVAFIPPRYLAERLLGLAPFLIAARQWEGDMIPQAWRVATVGDPLMTVPAPKVLALLPPREAPVGAADVSRSYADLREEARAALEGVRAATDGAPFARAMRTLVLLGDDRVAAQLWEIAAAKGFGAAVAADALGPLFRTHNRDAFTKAWPLAPRPTSEERDMLWALWAPVLKTTTDRAAVALLQGAVRTPYAHMDAEALLPAVKRLQGRDAAAAWLGRLLVAETDATGKRRLGDLQGKL